MYKNYKKIIAGFLAAAMIAPTTAGMTDMQSTHAYEVLGETTFDHKILPWHTVEASPAKQYFELSEGAKLVVKCHIRIWKRALGWLYDKPLNST